MARETNSQDPSFLAEIAQENLESVIALDDPPQPSRLAGNIFSLYVLQGVNYIVPLAILPYLVRVLGMERYGLMAFAQSFAQYFNLLTDYGFNFSGTRTIARLRSDPHAVSRAFSTVLAIKLLLLGFGFLLLSGIISVIPRFHENAGFFFAAYLAVLGNVLFPTWYFQGLEKMQYISILAGATRLAAGIALFIFVRGRQDAMLALVIQSAGLVACGVAGLWVAIRAMGVRLSVPSRVEIVEAWQDGAHLFISTAAISLYTNTNVFLVGIMAGNLEAGYFSAAEKLIRAMQGIITPVTQAVFPHMSGLLARSREDALRLAAQTLRWLGTLTFLSSIAILIFAGPIVTLCFGRGAAASIPVIRWIAFLPFLIAISNVLGIQTMVPFGLDKQFSWILIVAGLFNLVMVMPLTHFLGAVGAGISVSTVETLIIGAMLVVLSRHGIYVIRFREATA